MPDPDNNLQYHVDLTPEARADAIAHAAGTITPLEHQEKGVELAATRPAFLYAWKPGTGKTFLILFIMRERSLRTVIIAQKSIIPTAWKKDAAAIGQPIRIITAKNGKAKRAELIRSCPADTALVMNQEMLRSHYLDLIAWGVRRFVGDESSKFKNRTTKTYKAALQIADICQETYLLSGTPAPNSPTELWAQLRLLSPRAVGRTFFTWAYQWFVPIKVPIGRGRTAIKEWVPKHGTEDAFNDSLKPWVWYLTKAECVDLPGRNDSFRLFALSPDEQRVYDNVLDDFQLIVGGEAQIIKGEGQAMKLRQITGGAVRLDDKAIQIGSSKIDELFDLLDEIGADRRVVIWGEFRADIDRITTELNRDGYRSAISVYGGSKKPIEDVLAEFVEGTINVIVAHPRSLGHGTDGLQKVCSDAIYFGLSYSGEEHEQSRDRIDRNGQTESCTFHYLIAEGTIDEGLLETSQGKISKQDVLLNEFRRTRKTRRK